MLSFSPCLSSRIGFVLWIVTAAQAMPGVCPPPATGAFTGCYYSNQNLVGDPAFIRTDSQINFYWGNDSPDPSISPLNFSARWSGKFSFDGGIYTFSAVTSDGMRLYLDGNLILNRWRDQAPVMYTASQTVTSGTHLIVVEYYEKLGGATAQVSWQLNGSANPEPSGPQASPVISAFTATPNTISASGQPVTIAWSVAGADQIVIDNGVGNVTGQTSLSTTPFQSTVYMLTARNSTGSTSMSVAVTLAGAGPDQQPPTVPSLLSAGGSGTEVDLVWTASTDNVGIAGYRILRNGVALISVSGATLSYADRMLSSDTVYRYTVIAFDAAGNSSQESNGITVTAPASVTSPSVCPGPVTGSFTGCYYSNQTLSGDPVLVRSDSEINFNWANGSPDSSLSPLNFSARWAGNFNFDGGNYTFTVTTSDGMRVYLDDNLILNQWRDQAPTEYFASQTITPGLHLIAVEYYEKLGGASAQVFWQLNGTVSPGPTPQAPVISSFTAAPPTALPGQPVTLAWTVTGATSVTIDNGVGEVTTRATTVVSPAQSTTYTLTANNGAGATAASAPVGITSAPDKQPPIVPTLVSATAVSGVEVDLVWTASTDNIAVTGYQILRDGSPLTSLLGTTLSYIDRTVGANTSYSYTVQAYDAAGNFSQASNSIRVMTASAGPLSVKWYGACWQNASVLGKSGNYQSVDFSLTTSTPVPVQGTLFFAPNCDASQGMDNMNDFNSLTGSTHMIQGFIHFPDVTPTSAVYWIGSRTADGMCAPGSSCSGCLNYVKSTPSCDVLP